MKALLRAARFAAIGALSSAMLFIAGVAASAADRLEYYESIEYLTYDGNWDEACDGPLVCSHGEASYGAQLKASIAGMAKSMAEQGIMYDVAATQFYQGVTSGGIEQEFAYGGKVDQFVILDSGKLGLWDGMTMNLHAETRFGEDVNRQAVGLAPVNVAMLYPNAGEHDTAITGLQFSQALNEEWQVAFGKFNGLDLFYMLYPQTGRGINGFMNTSVVIPLAVARVFPLSFLGAGVLKLRGTQVEGALLVYDPNDCTTTTGFDKLGDNGANIMGMYRFFMGTEELPGSHLFGFIGATGEYTSLDPAGFVFVPGQGIVVPQQSGSWAALYVLEQRLWADRCNPSRNVGLLSQWCLADEETCPFQWTGNVAIQAQGLSAGRPDDTAGVAYFYTGLSDDFRALVNPVVNLNDLQGVELYYNAAVAECFHLTADLQVINPAEISSDTAVVFGLRGTVGL
jgi:porin